MATISLESDILLCLCDNVRKEHVCNVLLLKRPILECEVNLRHILWIAEVDVLELDELAFLACGKVQLSDLDHGFLEGIRINDLVVESVHQVGYCIALAASCPACHENDLSALCPVVGHDQLFFKI